MIKISILNALGSNLFVKDRELHIDGEKAWYLIERAKQNVVDLVLGFEPALELEEITDNVVLRHVCTSWLRTVDEVRNFYMKNDFEINVFEKI